MPKRVLVPWQKFCQSPLEEPCACATCRHSGAHVEECRREAVGQHHRAAEPPDATEAKGRKREKSEVPKKTPEERNLFWQRIIASAAVLAVFVSYCANRAMYRVSRDTLETSNRPWVLFDDVEIVEAKTAGHFWASVAVKNFGNSPALDVGRRITFREQGMAPSECADFDWADSEKVVLAPGQPIEAGFPKTLSQETHVFYAYGRIKYRDNFGGFHETCFCRFVHFSMKGTGVGSCAHFDWAT